LIDFHGCISLLAAVVHQWWQDARRNPAELAELAAWLGVDAGELVQRLEPASARRAAGPVAPGCCLWCGQELRRPARGRFPTYCGAACRAAASDWRRRYGPE
jgi:hypothetical protein